MQVRKTANRDWNVGSLECDLAMNFSFLAVQTVAGQSGHKNPQFLPTKTRAD
jgi:hypothetical protein